MHIEAGAYPRIAYRVLKHPLILLETLALSLYIERILENRYNLFTSTHKLKGRMDGCFGSKADV